jgi:nucleotide-binding universal stress UspA family protein
MGPGEVERQHEGIRHARNGTRGTEMKSFDQLRIVVGIDGSRQSLVALEWALGEAAALDAQVEVVHCWHPVSGALFGSPDDLHSRSLGMLENEVHAALATLPASVAQPLVLETSCPGRAANVLTDRSAGAHLLVLGAHRRTDGRDLAFGRVAASCLRHAGCPVVIVENERTIIRHESTAPAPI